MKDKMKFLNKAKEPKKPKGKTWVCGQCRKPNADAEKVCTRCGRIKGT